MSTDSEHCQEQLQVLIGGTITDVIVDQDGYFGIRVLKGAGKKGRAFNVWVQSDAEGNDVGWVHVEDADTGKKI